MARGRVITAVPDWNFQMMPHPAILVVDDQSSNLIAMEAVFEGEPVELVKAGSGAEALKIMLQRDFALVLLDVQMPDLDGFGISHGEGMADMTPDFAPIMGKTPVEANDSPGFISNRILCPMINEAVFALQENVGTPEAIDTVMKLGMNHPMGPLTLADLIGLDVVLYVMEVLQRELGETAAKDPKDVPPGDYIRVCTLNAVTGLESPIVFLVGVRDHEHIAGAVLLRDYGDQPVGIEFDTGEPGFVGHGHKLPGGPAIVKAVVLSYFARFQPGSTLLPEPYLRVT